MEFVEHIQSVQVKDSALDTLAWNGNVAQFVSFGPDLVQRYSRALGFAPNHRFQDLDDAIGYLLKVTPEHAVNVRSFHPDRPRGSAFRYRLTNSSDVANCLNQLAADALFTIVNETIDVNDGGVSGVVEGGVLECAPQDTPRCVEVPEIFSARRSLAVRMLTKIYGFEPALNYPLSTRVEFSLHPLKRGYLNQHTIIWEFERKAQSEIGLDGLTGVAWPNRFSRFIGDKAFGLLLADSLGLPVPRTTVIGRSVAPFHFGADTNSSEIWIRTCPCEPDPGRYPTKRGWTDPFQLLEHLGENRNAIVSVLSQQAVEASYSGALICTSDGSPVIEGVNGNGTLFMLGLAGASELPAQVCASVTALFRQAKELIGPVRLEWAYDNAAWVLQLHCDSNRAQQSVVVSGHADRWLRFSPSSGLDALRALIQLALDDGAGIIVDGNVGLTSHIGELLRAAAVPSRFDHYPEKVVRVQ